MAKKSIISIDMGGTKTLAAIINSSEGIKERIKVSTNPDSSEHEHADALALLVNDIIEKSGMNKEDIAAVCIGVPGTVNPNTGLIGIATNIQMENYNIKKELEQRVSIPVIVENDVNLGAIGIKNFGAGKNSKNLLAVFVGTGIGGGLIIDGKIHRGSYFSASELGHIKVDPAGELCKCGKRGCFEAIASRTAVVNQVISDVKSGKKSVLAEKILSGKKIKSKVLASAVINNDQVTINKVTAACNVIGRVLANISNVVNVDTIVLGGGLIYSMSDYLLPIIIEAYISNVYKPCGSGVKIIASELGDDAALWGGISLAEEFLGIKV